MGRGKAYGDNLIFLLHFEGKEIEVLQSQITWWGFTGRKPHNMDLYPVSLDLEPWLWHFNSLYWSGSCSE